jgi:hypothetical protein
MSTYGWAPLTARNREGETTIESEVVDGLSVHAKTARNGAELVVVVQNSDRKALFLIDPANLTLRAMTFGQGDEPWNLLHAMRRTEPRSPVATEEAIS